MEGNIRNKRGTLTRSAIIKEALALVDELGQPALTYRRLAERLGVGTMSLYNYVPSREDLIKDIVALMLSEVDLDPVPGEAWGETLTRVAKSHHAMALRHPRAYSLLTSLPHDEPPVLEHSLAVLRLHQPYGDAPALPPGSLNIVIAYTTGFLDLLTHSILREKEAALVSIQREDLSSPDPFVAELAQVIDPGAFDRGLAVIMQGLSMLDKKLPQS